MKWLGFFYPLSAYHVYIEFLYGYQLSLRLNLLGDCLEKATGFIFSFTLYHSLSWTPAILILILFIFLNFIYVREFSLLFLYLSKEGGHWEAFWMYYFLHDVKTCWSCFFFSIYKIWWLSCRPHITFKLLNFNLLQTK